MSAVMFLFPHKTSQFSWLVLLIPAQSPLHYQEPVWTPFINPCLSLLWENVCPGGTPTSEGIKDPRGGVEVPRVFWGPLREGSGQWLSSCPVVVCLLIPSGDNGVQWDLMGDEGTNINSFLTGHNGRHIADDIFKYIFLNENVWILIKI